MTPSPVAIGLAGAGPWARTRYAPVFAAGPETRLAAVWSRHPDNARPTAEAYGARLATTFAELVDSCDAVALCVPPAVQAELAPIAAAANKPLLLDKPLAVDLASAQRLAAAIIESRVPTMFALTFRYSDTIRQFLADVPRFAAATGARAVMVTGSQLSGPYAESSWRHEKGVLFDEGPHILDLVDVAFGPIVAAQVHRGRDGWTGMLLEHEGGMVSELSLANRVGLERNQIEVELFGASGRLHLDVVEAYTNGNVFENLRREFADVARGAAHHVDIRRALYVQGLIDRIERASQT